MRRALLALPLLLALLVPSAAAAPPPPPTIVEGNDGAALFAANCARCHGPSGAGIATNEDPRFRGPDLRRSGALAADFYLTTGYMPLSDARTQPVRSRQRLSPEAVKALTEYVAKLGDGPPIPTPHPETGSVADGRELFTDHCSGCHQVVAEGGILTGAKAPPLDEATPRQIAEAVRIGPYAMPEFTERDLSDDELNSIIAYVAYAKDPTDAGGWGINHLGPYPEGMVTWLIAIPVLLLVCVVIGKRLSS